MPENKTPEDLIKNPACPLCETDVTRSTVYLDEHDRVLGCGNCVRSVDADELPELYGGATA